MAITIFNIITNKPILGWRVLGVFLTPYSSTVIDNRRRTSTVQTAGVAITHPRATGIITRWGTLMDTATAFKEVEEATNLLTQEGKVATLALLTTPISSSSNNSSTLTLKLRHLVGQELVGLIRPRPTTLHRPSTRCSLRRLAARSSNLVQALIPLETSIPHLQVMWVSSALKEPQQWGNTRTCQAEAS